MFYYLLFFGLFFDIYVTAVVVIILWSLVACLLQSYKTWHVEAEQSLHLLLLKVFSNWNKLFGFLQYGKGVHLSWKLILNSSYIQYCLYLIFLKSACFSFITVLHYKDLNHCTMIFYLGAVFFCISWYIVHKCMLNSG